MLSTSNRRFERNPLVTILIDMQLHFTQWIEKETRGKLIQTQTGVIQQCAKEDIPLIVLEYARRGPTIMELGIEIKKVPRIIPMTRDSENGFKCTELHEILHELKAERLLLMGVNASSCVLATAQAAYDRGYRALTSTDLIADAHDFTESTTNKARVWYEQADALLSDPQLFFAQAK